MRSALYIAFIAFSASAAFSQVNTLNFRPGAAEYSRALDRIIFISGNPNLLHVYNPASNSDVTVGLASAPTALSVSPDGTHAAVAVGQSVAYINLQTAAVQNTYTIDVTQSRVILGTNDLYIMPNYNGTIEDLNLSTGKSVSQSFFYASGGRVNPVNGQLYTTQDGLSPDALQRISFTSTGITSTYWPYWGQPTACEDLWFSPDGSRIYTGCGTVANSSTSPSQDMTYLTSLPGQIQTLTESSALGEVAYVERASSNITNTPVTNDTSLKILDSQYLAPKGTFALTPFTVGPNSFASHGKWAFFSADSSNLYVVVQADSPAGLLQDFAIQTIALSNPSACAATFAASALSVGAEGALSTVTVNAGTNCTFSATSNASWIALGSGAYGSGSGSFTLEVQRNMQSQARTGTVTIGNQTLSVTQDAASKPGVFAPLGFNVVSSKYDRQLDRMLIIASNPNELHILDPLTGSDSVVPLPKAPLSIGVALDGMHAAIGHDGWMSYVDLQQARVTQVYATHAKFDRSLLLAPNGYAYGFGSGPSSFLQLSTGSVSLRQTYTLAAPAVLDSTGDAMYASGPWLSRYNITNGAPASVDTTYANDGTCGNLWLANDGARLFNSCGLAFYVSDIPGQDLGAAGSLPLANGVISLDDSQAAGQIAVIGGSNYPISSTDDTQLQLYARNGLTLLSQETLPPFSVAGTLYKGHGQFVSWNSNGTKLFVVEKADTTAGLTNPYAIYTLNNPSGLAGCTYTVDTTPLVLTGQYSSFNLAATSPNCSWQATSDVSWLSITNQATAPGIQGTTVSVQGNSSNLARTGHLTVGGHTISVTQDASSCIIGSMRGINIDAAGSGASVSFSMPSNCAWTATSGVPWIKILNSSGNGSASVSLTVAPNTASSWRSSSIDVAGQTAYVSQKGYVQPTPNGPVALAFVPVTPCRVVDTRLAHGPFGGPMIAAGTARDFNIPASPCAIPTSAKAYALNVTVVPSNALGYLTVSPSGTFRPFVSTLNSLDGRVKANAAIIPAGTAGSVNVFATDDTHVVLDITGYFVDANTANSLAFWPITPCRVVDTRTDAQGSLASGQPRDISIQAAGCNVPTGATAYSLNFTSIPKGPLHYLTTWPAGRNQPFVSTLNAPKGTVTANAAIISAGDSGKISAYATDNSDLAVDINGYFAPPATGGLHFYAIPPCRALDTRGISPLTGTTDFDAGSACGVPSTASALVLNSTVVPRGMLNFLALWPSDQSQPWVSTLNADDGAITSNLAIVPSWGTFISAYGTQSTDLVLDVFGYFAP